MLFVLTALPLSLALFAFVLQRRGGGGGGLVDPAGIGQLAAGGNSCLPGVVLQLDLRSSRTGAGGGGGAITNSDCANQLLQRGGRMHQPGWKYDILNAATPKGVTVIHPTKELEDKQAKSRIWNETWLAGFFFKPCNYELFVKQSLNMEMAIVFAREAGMDWIIHLDTDELLHPAGVAEYSLRRLLQDVAADVDMAVFPNYLCIKRQEKKNDSSLTSLKGSLTSSCSIALSCIKNTHPYDTHQIQIIHVCCMAEDQKKKRMKRRKQTMKETLVSIPELLLLLSSMAESSCCFRNCSRNSVRRMVLVTSLYPL